MNDVLKGIAKQLLDLDRDGDIDFADLITLANIINNMVNVRETTALSNLLSALQEAEKEAQNAPKV